MYVPTKALDVTVFKRHRAVLMDRCVRLISLVNRARALFLYIMIEGRLVTDSLEQGMPFVYFVV